MIVCHCTQISDHDIRAAIDWMRAADPDTVVTPGKVYRALGKRADCGGCLPLFIDSMLACDSFAIPIHPRGLRRVSRQETQDEGRPQGHRISQRRAAE